MGENRLHKKREDSLTGRDTGKGIKRTTEEEDNKNQKLKIKSQKYKSKIKSENLYSLTFIFVLYPLTFALFSMKKRQSRGKLTVIAGPMFSGKTGKLVALVDVFTRMGHTVLTVKPSLDIRYSEAEEIHSHDHKKSKALVVDGETPEAIIDKILETKADKVIFDEVQFFDKEKVLAVIQILRKKGIHVVAAGLLYDYQRKPFGATGDLLGLADERLELFAVCQKCGSLARHSERVKGSKKQIDVGATNKYIAVCESCHRIYR